MNIDKDEDELFPTFNQRFAKTLKDIPNVLGLSDGVCLVVYLGDFDNELSYLLRDKDPKTLHQAYGIAMNIENNLKYEI